MPSLRVWYAAMLTTACVTAPTGPDTNASRVPPRDRLVEVRLLRPSDGAVIAQNDSTIGCAAHANRGFGLRIGFEWAAVPSSASVAEYEVHAQRRGAQVPIVSRAVAESSLMYTSCNAFVADPNLDQWEWRVRAKSQHDVWGPWSPTRRLEFEPCRLRDGRPCHAA